MNAVTNFAFEEMLVRVIEREGEPWFVANDVCRVLDLRNPRQVISRLDDDERDDVHITDVIGREQGTSIINESGLYSLILTSRKPEAKKFKKWVTSEVLPAIRKTGSYGMPTADELEGVPFFDPVNALAPLGSRVQAVAQVARRYGREAEAVAMRLYRLGDFAAVAQARKAERGRECLDHLLSAKIDDGLPVRDHLQVAYAADDSMHAPLWNHGMRAIIGPPSGMLVATKADLLLAIFAGTEWAGGRHSAALRTLPGAHSDKTQKFGGGTQSSTIFLPIGVIAGK